jgi:succinyl-CoA synthetase alpha subunit
MFHTKLMMEYGTKIVAGVTPGKGGTSVHGIPVYDTVNEAIEAHKATASIVFVPAPGAKEAAFEAIDAGLNPVIIITEGIPVRDTMEIVAVTREKKTSLVGPNTPGIITPGECKLGIMPGQVFGKGDVGLMSRSGTLTYEIAAGLTKSGVGETTCVGIGGDPIVGLTFIELLEIFREDRDTKAVALIGEIGGNAEEQAAEYIKKTSYPKPVAAYIAGRTAPPGKRMGHAGAIISGKTGTADSKIEALRSAGVSVAEKPTDVARLLANLIGK